VTHREGRPQKITSEVISFIETHELAGAMILRAQLARMAKPHLNFDGAPIRRETVCKIRKKLRIFYRPPFLLRDFKPEQEPARMAFVSLMLELLKFGRIKHLIFSGESRFCRGPDCLWVRVRGGAWNETSTVMV
jgi:hypothetical protein